MISFTFQLVYLQIAMLGMHWLYTIIMQQNHPLLHDILKYLQD